MSDNQSLDARLVLGVEPRLASVRSVVEERMEAAAAALEPANFRSVLPVLALPVLHGVFEAIGADDGVVWVLTSDESELVAIFHHSAVKPGSGARVGAGTGLLGMVMASQQAQCENRIDPAAEAAVLHPAMAGRVSALAAAPFFVSSRPKGLIAACRTRPHGTTDHAPGFEQTHLAELRLLASLVTRLLDGELLRRVIGWDGN